MVTKTCNTGSMAITDVRPLTAEDRCDRCGAQAYVRYSRDGLELLMCVHHNVEHGDKAAAWADSIRDESAKLMTP